MRYPRRRLLRAVLCLIGRLLMWLLTHCIVTGTENLPKRGPLILVGNHVAVLEAVMMVLYAPWMVELIGAGDIPLDKRFAWIMQTYGYIPIKRGTMDRAALSRALEVLKQGGVIGVFPEGGIWETTLRQGKTGVAWLSSQANVPIIPIGFGGIDGALAAALSFKRPRVTMNIGRAIPPVQDSLNGQSRKVALDTLTRQVMQAIEDLIPEADKARWTRILDERFEMQISLQHPDGSITEPPAEINIQDGAALAKFFHRPTMLDVFARNLKLPVQALQQLDDDPRALGAATEAALGYLRDNPHFLTYRFGYAEGAAMEAGLRQLRDLCGWAEQHKCHVIIRPVRRYRLRGKTDEIVEDKPGALPTV